MDPNRRHYLLVLVSALVLVATWNAVSRRSGNSRIPTGPPSIDTHGIRFEEIASASGLHFHWNATVRRPLNIMDGFGCGCAFLDYDGDGFQDILLVNEPYCGLFRNEGRGHFRDVTSSTGLHRIRGAWKGCAVADFDGDGLRDLLLTGYHRLALLRNTRGHGFSDITRQAGLDPSNQNDWGASAGFMDLDGDGDLDLVVQNYLEWGPAVVQLCDLRGFRTACPPEVHDPEYARLYRNNGGGTFTDVTRRSGMKRLTGYGMVLAFADADLDGRQDFYLGNDGRDANFMQNLGRLVFRDVSLENGTAAAGGNELAAMGADWADFDRDGDPDLVVSGFSEESDALFRNDGHGSFHDASAAVGLASPTYLPLGFGTKFADVDNDGWPDLFLVNGHIFDEAARVIPGTTYRQPSMLFRNEKGQHFTDLAPASGGALSVPLVGRGSAAGDIDNDGRIDLLAVDYEGGPMLFHNRSETTNHWITLDLRSRSRNRHAYGARVRLTAPGEVWTAQVSPASSYLSSSDPRLHFGLGKVTTIDAISVWWPSGQQDVYSSVAVDRVVTITEGQRVPRN